MAVRQRYLKPFIREMENRVDGMPISMGKRSFGGLQPTIGPVGVEIRNMTGQMYVHPRTGFGQAGEEMPVQFGDAATIWGTEGMEASAAEISQVDGSLNGLNYWQGVGTAASQYVVQITDGAVRWALKFIAGSGYITSGSYSYSPTAQQGKIYVDPSVWNYKVRAAIGFIRYMVNGPDWNSWSPILTASPTNWWDVNSSFLFQKSASWFPPITSISANRL